MFDAQGGFDGEAFAAALDALMASQGRALVILNTPCHNPTGYSLNDADWSVLCTGLRAAAAKGPVSLCIDLAYARFGTAPPTHWLPYAESLANDVLLLVAWTASKSYAQYGARIGALVASHPDADERNRVRAALAYSCRGTWSNCNHLGMLAVTDLLEQPALAARADSEREVLRTLLGERVEAFNRLASSAGLNYPRYEGGFFVTIFTPDAAATAASMRELGVYVVPLDGAVRVALCSTPVRDVPRLIEALALGLSAATPAG
jgi:aromatic-amino-acid transaminase